MPRNYIVHALEGEPVIAVACSVCRTAVLYKSPYGASQAINYHPKVCKSEEILCVELVTPWSPGNEPPNSGGSQKA